MKFLLFTDISWADDKNIYDKALEHWNSNNLFGFEMSIRYRYQFSSISRSFFISKCENFTEMCKIFRDDTESL